MRKNKKQYFWFPVVEKAETCPCCKKPLVQSKLMAVLYDGLNQNSIQQAHKMAYCSDCHVPFLTKKAVSGIEGENPGFHLETGKLIPKMSKAFLLKKVSTPALPIQNIPKNTLVFVGEEHLHKCGENMLERYQGIMHGKVPMLVKINKCKSCGQYLISPSDHHRIKKQCVDYIFGADGTWENMFPDKKNLYLLNVNQYTKQICLSCSGRLADKTCYFKNDNAPTLRPKNVKECSKCGKVFGRVTSFDGKPYSRYKFSYEFFKKEQFYDGKKQIAIKTGDFLTRHNLAWCIKNKHSMEDITARIRVVDAAGAISECDIPAVRCDTCGKLFLLEAEYQKLREKGVPLCSIVENEYWRKENGEWQGWFGRGEVCWAAPFGHFIWLDNETPYDIEGVYYGESLYFIPESYRRFVHAGIIIKTITFWIGINQSDRFTVTNYIKF